jgi:hypothetical protein
MCTIASVTRIPCLIGVIWAEFDFSEASLFWPSVIAAPNGYINEKF